MKIDEINSLSVDDLWSLHDDVVSVLSRKPEVSCFRLLEGEPAS